MKEERLGQILSEKEIKRMPDDFDDHIMSIIRKHAANNVTERKYIRLMYLFFALGVMLGFVIALMFHNPEFSFMGKEYTVHKLAIALPMVLIILMIFERIYKATLVSMGKDKFTVM